MHQRYLCLAAAALVFALVAAPAAATPDLNGISLAGQVTHVDLDNSFFVVSPDGSDIVVPCGPGNTWCDQLAYGDEVVISAHFDWPREVCSGFELPDNPIVIDVIHICKEGECVPLAGAVSEDEKKE